MNLHTTPPACHTTAEPQPRAWGFREHGQYCYQDADGLRLTPGCEGCRRMRTEPIL